MYFFLCSFKRTQLISYSQNMGRTDAKEFPQRRELFLVWPDLQHTQIDISPFKTTNDILIICMVIIQCNTELTFAGQNQDFSEVSFALFRSCSPVLSIKKEISTDLNTTLQSICCGLCQHDDFYASLKEHRFTKSNCNHMGTFKAGKEENELKMKEHGKVSYTKINSKSNQSFVGMKLCRY